VYIIISNDYQFKILNNIIDKLEKMLEKNKFILIIIIIIIIMVQTINSKLDNFNKFFLSLFTCFRNRNTERERFFPKCSLSSNSDTDEDFETSYLFDIDPYYR